MTAETFTPGPWQVSGVRHSGDLKIGRDARLHAVGPDGDAVAMVFFDMKTGRGLRDARLIAAAPDLLSALERIERNFGLLLKGQSVRDVPEMAAEVRAAILKAKGEQP